MCSAISPISLNEICPALTRIPNWNAPGSCGIPNSIFKLALPILGDCLAAAYTTMLISDTIPTSLLKGIIVLIPKKTAWTGHITETCPMTLLGSPCKLFIIILTSHLTSVIDQNHLLNPLNISFTPGLRCQDAHSMCKALIDISKLCTSSVFLAQLNICKAFV